MFVPVWVLALGVALVLAAVIRSALDRSRLRGVAEDIEIARRQAHTAMRDAEDSQRRGRAEDAILALSNFIVRTHYSDADHLARALKESAAEEDAEISGGLTEPV